VANIERKREKRRGHDTRVTWLAQAGEIEAGTERVVDEAQRRAVM